MQVLHCDPALVAVNKPPGRLVIPGRGRPEPTVLSEATERFGRLWVVHRLDRGTSGVLLFARTAEAHRALNLAFDRHEVGKLYLALVAGIPPEELRVEAAIAPARRGRMRPARPGDPRGKPAATSFRRIQAFPGPQPMSLVRAIPETGRTHQIRVHLAHAGHPLLVDPDYGDSEPIRNAAGEAILDRTPLHASRLEVPHPSGGMLVVEAPLPADMERVIAWGKGAL